MAIGIDLDFTGGALQVHGGKDLAIIADAAGIAQHVRTRLDLHVGEWFLDTSAGTDWFGRVLGKGATDQEIQAEVRRILEGTPGIATVDELTIVRDTGRRSATVAWTATTDTGEVLAGVKGV
jgi:hypothetical protein